MVRKKLKRGPARAPRGLAKSSALVVGSECIFVSVGILCNSHFDNRVNSQQQKDPKRYGECGHKSVLD